MSGVYIPNQQIPENCGACPLVSGYDIPLRCSIAPCVGKLVSDFQDAVKNGVRTEWCTIIPVPDHGRLGDLTELEGRIKAWMQTNRRAMTEDVEPYVRAVLRGIQETPTIIPASGKEGEA